MTSGSIRVFAPWQIGRPEFHWPFSKQWIVAVCPSANWKPLLHVKVTDDPIAADFWLCLSSSTMLLAESPSLIALQNTAAGNEIVKGHRSRQVKLEKRFCCCFYNWWSPWVKRLFVLCSSSLSNIHHSLNLLVSQKNIMSSPITTFSANLCEFCFEDRQKAVDFSETKFNCPSLCLLAIKIQHLYIKLQRKSSIFQVW